MTIYFTSDLHLGDPRLKVFYRDLYFNSVDEMNQTIINNFNNILTEKDMLVIVGDACHDIKYIDLLDEIKCKEKILIIGNYDEDKLDELKPKFSVVHKQKYIQLEYKENDNFGVLISHKPTDIVREKDWGEATEFLDLGICGHIHSLWRVQKYPIPIVNVSADIWNFKPVSFSRIFNTYHAILHYYDENVFPLK